MIAEIERPTELSDAEQLLGATEMAGPCGGRELRPRDWKRHGSGGRPDPSACAVRTDDEKSGIAAAVGGVSRLIDGNERGGRSRVSTFGRLPLFDLLSGLMTSKAFSCTPCLLGATR